MRKSRPIFIYEVIPQRRVHRVHLVWIAVKVVHMIGLPTHPGLSQAGEESQEIFPILVRQSSVEEL